MRSNPRAYERVSFFRVLALLAKVVGRFNFYLISMLSALQRAISATGARELSGGLLDVMGMLMLLGSMEAAF